MRTLHRTTVLGSSLLLGFLAASCGKAAPPGKPAASDALAAMPAEVHLTPVPELNLPANEAESTKKMVQKLRDLVVATKPEESRFENSARAAHIRNAFPSLKGGAPTYISARQQLADELLNAGQTEEAIAAIEPLMHLTDEEKKGAPADVEQTTRKFIAFANMRLGEQQNCIAHHGFDSCLFPIKGGGVHVDQKGSRAAIAGFKEVLAKDPNDLDARWLLNVAAMTVGEYPQGVPAEYAIPPSTFDSEHPMKRFWDRAQPAGVAVRGRAGGAIMDDFDGDGLLDLIATGMGLREQMHYFKNNGDGTFTDRTSEAGLIGEWGGLYAVQADYDNDGDVDFIIMRGGWMAPGGKYPSSLLRNKGDGTFEDVTEAAGLYRLRPTQTAAWGDYDGDGWVDLFIGVETSFGKNYPSELWHNNHDGTFTDMAEAVFAAFPKADLGWVKGASWGDFNNDGKLDLYVSVHSGDKILFRNDGPKTGGKPGEQVFTNVAKEAKVQGTHDTFPTWFWDYDNDGWADILVAGYTGNSKTLDSIHEAAALALGKPSKTEVPRLFHNNHDGTFTDVTKEKKLDRVAMVMGSAFGDIDNDGRLDCYMGNGDPMLRTLLPNRMFRQGEDGAFQDVTTATGTGHLQKGHAVAFGDIDNDGDQDIYESMGGAFEGDLSQNALYENPGNDNHWVTLRLQGKKANRSGIGAVIKATVHNEGGADRDIYALVGPGGSFAASSLQAEMGLGAAKSIASIEIRWPGSGTVQTFKDVPMDAVYTAVEDEKALAKVEVKKFKLPKGAAPE
jgi:FG-GAP-like repeat/ASPIC and UnbV